VFDFSYHKDFHRVRSVGRDTVIMRLGKLLAIIGLAVAAVSFVCLDSRLGLGGSVQQGEYKGRLYGLTGDIYAEIMVESDQKISVYVLSWSDSIKLMENRSLAETSPVVRLDNISTFTGIFEIPLPGIYSFIVTSNYNETVYFDMDMNRILPQKGILVPGIIITITGVILVIAKRAQPLFGPICQRDSG
jgi:hypothetical protein